MTRLPRGVERLLAWTVPLDQQEPIAGDLLEEHARRRDVGFAPSALAWAATFCGAVNLGPSFERTMTVVVRSSNDAAANASIIRSAVSSVDRELPVGIIRTWGR